MGMKVYYEGIRMTPEAIVAEALDRQVHVLGLSVLSGSHMPLVREVLDKLTAAGAQIPVIVGGIIPEADAEALKARGVAAVYTPKDFDLNGIMDDIAALAAGEAPLAAE